MTQISDKGLIGIGLGVLVVVIGAIKLFKYSNSESSTNKEDWVDNSVNDPSTLSQFPPIEGGRKKTKKQKKRARVNNSRKRR